MGESKVGLYEFYCDRIRTCSKYGPKSGYELLTLIRRCALYDNDHEMLSDDDYFHLVNLADDVAIILMDMEREC